MAGIFLSGLDVTRGRRSTGTPSPVTELTEEAAVSARPSEDLRVDPLVPEGALVAQGAPLLRLRKHPELVLTAPMAGRVASIDLGPGRRLMQVVLFREDGGDRHRHDLSAQRPEHEAPLRALLLASGLWRSFRRRPFGRMPHPAERPAAIFVMAADTRPGAPDPLVAILDREEDLLRGLAALARLTDGPVFLCQSQSEPAATLPPRTRFLRIAELHPSGLPGLQIHTHRPATPDAPVWDIHVEDAAAIGALFATGYLPETRLISVHGPALREPRLVHAQPGADLRGLTHGHVLPGPHMLLSGSSLEGYEARWLAPRERLVTALPRAHADTRPHWFRTALRGASRPLPLIPTAALDQSLGGAIPAAPLLRALSSGDSETAVRLGALSLLEEDLALADYVTCAEPRLAVRLRGLLDRIEAEEGA